MMVFQCFKSEYCKLTSVDVDRWCNSIEFQAEETLESTKTVESGCLVDTIPLYGEREQSLTFCTLVAVSWRDGWRYPWWYCSWDHSIAPRSLGHPVHSSIFSRRYLLSSALFSCWAEACLRVTGQYKLWYAVFQTDTSSRWEWFGMCQWGSRTDVADLKITSTAMLMVVENSGNW